MSVSRIKVFATPEAYEILKDSENPQTFKIMEAVKKMVLNNDLSHTGYGFGNCPIMLVTRDPVSADDHPTILLYVGKADHNPIALWNETMAIHQDLDHHMETAIQVSFDV